MGTICPSAWLQLAACSTSSEGAMMGWIIGLTCLFAWFTHIFTCFAEGLWGFLIAGALLFPIGVLHGMYLWFR
tara:strand:- start:2407 stop:2625 length:219 start_codon:yes stop_codon:yes gene_type:complete